MKKLLFILLFIQSTLLAQDDIRNICSEFVGGKPGVNAFYMQLCYDSTFYFHEWHSRGIEIIDGGEWWFNREDETIVLNSLDLQMADYAYYNFTRTKGYLFDSIPFKLKDGLIYLFEEDWDTIPMHLKPAYGQRILYYLVPEPIDWEQRAFDEKQDSIRKLGPFQHNPLYIHLFMTENKGFLGMKNRWKENKKRKAEEKEQRKADKLAEEERRKKADTEAYVNAKEKEESLAAKKDSIPRETPKEILPDYLKEYVGEEASKKKKKSKKKTSRLEYIQEMNRQRMQKRNKGADL